MSEDPKQFLQRLGAQSIWPGEEYYLNIAKAEEPWEEGEYCPLRIERGTDPINKAETLDGLYGLSDLVAAAVDYNGYGRNEDAYEKGMEEYEAPIFSAINIGKTEGHVNGVAGPLKWRIVYLDPSMSWSPQNCVPVVPNKQYGEEYKPRDVMADWMNFMEPGQEPGGMAEALAAALLDGDDDPKAALQGNFGQPRGVYVVRTEYIDPSGPPHDEIFQHEREALDHFKKRYLRMGGGEWYLKLLFRPDRVKDQAPARTRTLIFASYDRGDRQLDADLKNGVNVLEAFRAYAAREKLSWQIHREAGKRFPNTGEEIKHWLSGEMTRVQTNDDWFNRDDFFRDAWRRRAKHAPDCQCYHCQELQKPTAREFHAEQERLKADAYRRWKRAVAYAQRRGIKPPPEPRSGGYDKYDY